MGEIEGGGGGGKGDYSHRYSTHECGVCNAIHDYLPSSPSTPPVPTSGLCLLLEAAPTLSKHQ